MPQTTLAMIGSRGHQGIVLRELPDLPEVELVAVADGGDTAAPLLDWAAKNHHHPARFEDHRTMFDEIRPTIAVVCGPFELHAQMCLDAIERGIHVYTEKPAALTSEDLHRLRAACDARPGVRLVAMMKSRYDPGFYAAWELVRRGAIGDLRLINARKSYKLGKRPGYYHNRETYGGTIPWVGGHAIDWVYWLFGAPFETVAAVHSIVPEGQNGTMERSALCQFTLGGGRAASVSIDVLRPETASTHGDDWVRLVGTEGVIEARPKELRLINRDSDGTAPAAVSCPRTPFADFVNHVNGTTDPLIDTRATLDVTEACLLARLAADERRIVQFAEPH